MDVNQSFFIHSFIHSFYSFSVNPAGSTNSCGCGNNESGLKKSVRMVEVLISIKLNFVNCFHRGS
jgi:hypothetical protein